MRDKNYRPYFIHEKIEAEKGSECTLQCLTGRALESDYLGSFLDFAVYSVSMSKLLIISVPQFSYLLVHRVQWGCNVLKHKNIAVSKEKKIKKGNYLKMTAKKKILRIRANSVHHSATSLFCYFTILLLVFSWWIIRSGIAGSYGKFMFNFLWNSQTVFLRVVLYHFIFPPATYEGFSFSTWSPTLVILF